MKKIIVFMLLLFAVPALAGDVTLAWDAVDHPDLRGYIVYCSDAEGAYTEPRCTADVGNVTVANIVVDGSDGDTVHFVVTAYGDDVDSSGYSNEVTHTFPRLVLPTPANLRVVPAN